MKYTEFGNLDLEVSVLGFGAMRLPILDNEYSALPIHDLVHRSTRLFCFSWSNMVRSTIIFT